MSSRKEIRRTDLMDDLTPEEQEELNNLYKAILTLKTEDELHAFFEDLCSVNELKSMLHRWQIVLRIDKNLSYEDSSAPLLSAANP